MEINNISIWNSTISNEEKILKEKFSEIGNLPKHIAIIMDGNGRWAINRNLDRSYGHKEGIESIKKIVKAASNIGINYLTLYAFSIENWNRPKEEVDILMNLLVIHLNKELDQLHRNNVKITTIGNFSSLPATAQEILNESIEMTKHNNGLNLTFALSYSGRWDIIQAVKKIANEIKLETLEINDIDVDIFSQYLTTRNLPDPDLLIRTSGEMRISNFLLWEIAYSEIFVTDKYWPDFDKKDLYLALIDYMTRERRFGKTSAQISNNISDENIAYLKKVVNEIQ